MEREKISLGLQGIDDEFIVNAKSSQKKRWLQTTMGKAVLVACLPLLCAAGIATGVFVDVIDVFAPLFGGTNPQTEIIQEIGRPVGASATDNGVTVTVDAIIGDENTATVVYSFSYENGTPFHWEEIPSHLEPDEDGWIVSNSISFDSYNREKPSSQGMLEWVGNGTVMEGTGSRTFAFVDTDPDDGTSQYIETLSFKPMPIGKKMTCVFYNIGSYEHIYKFENGQQITKSETFTPLVEGEWEIEYRFDYGDSSKTLIGDEVFTHNQNEIFVNEVVISPLSLNINLEFKKIDLGYEEFLQTFENKEDITEEAMKKELELYREETDANGEVYKNIPLFLTKKDGTVLEFENLTGSMNRSSENENVVANIRLLFEEIIPLEDIATVTFGDITVEVNS